MPRLPRPGGDSGSWGDILNDFLLTAHKLDGSIKDSAVSESSIAAGAVTSEKISDAAISENKLSEVVKTKLNATATVRSVNNKTGAVVIGKDDIELGNVDNTSDVDKPISNAVEAVLETKVDNSVIGTPGGVASLGADGKVLASQLPAATTNTGISKAKSALLPFRVAMGGRNYRRVNIVIHGDSTEEGIGANANNRNRAWPARLAAKLRTINLASSETIDPGHPNFIPSCSPSAMHFAGNTSWWPTGRPPAGWSIVRSHGPNGYALKADAAGSTLTLSLPANVGVTTYALVYRRGPDATYGFTSTLNGNTTTAVPVTGVVRDGVWTSVQNTSASVSNTVVITAGGVNTIIDGVVLFGNNINRGTAVFNLAQGGSRAVDFLPTSMGGHNWIADNQGPNVEAGVQSLIDMNPDLIVRGGFYNDMRFSQGRSAAQFKQDESALIAGMRAVLPSKTIPVVLLTKWKPSDSFLSSAVSYGRNWDDYVRVRDEIAASDPFCIHIKLDDYFPRPTSSEATSHGMDYIDDVHGGDRIYGAVGDLIAQTLMTEA